MGRLDGKVIVVTGGANGLGAEYVEALHTEGAHVAILDVDEASGRALTERLNARASFHKTDVTNEVAVREALAQIGRLDVLVNNAGIYPHKKLGDITISDWREVIRINLDSVFICTQEAIPYLRESRTGKIVNVLTNLIWVLAPNMAHYMASKAGILGFTRGAARELGALGITINALAPGANTPETLTPDGIDRMRELVSYQVIKRPQFACDLTGAMVFLCSSDADFMTGQVLCVDGGVVAH